MKVLILELDNFQLGCAGNFHFNGCGTYQHLDDKIDLQRVTESTRLSFPDKTIDLKTVDLKKLKVRDLRKILSDWDEECEGCIEKTDFIKRIEELKPKYMKDEL